MHKLAEMSPPLRKICILIVTGAGGRKEHAVAGFNLLLGSCHRLPEVFHHLEGKIA